MFLSVYVLQCHVIVLLWEYRYNQCFIMMVMMMIMSARQWCHCRQAAEAEVPIIRCHQWAVPVYRALILCRRPGSQRSTPSRRDRRRAPARVGPCRAEAAAGRCFGRPCCCAACWWRPCPRCWLSPAARPTYSRVPTSSSTSRRLFNSVSLCGGYNYDSTEIRRALYTRSTVYQVIKVTVK